MELETTQQPFRNDLLADLLASIDEQEIQELGLDSIEADKVIIQSSSDAEYYLKKVKDIDNELRSIEATAQVQLERHKQKIDNWKESSSRSLVSAREYFASLLEEYTRRSLDGSSKKSIKLIEGTLALKAQQPEYDYDDDKLVEWLQKHSPQHVKSKPSVDKVLLKKDSVVKEGKLVLAGKEVNGVTVTERGDKFDIK